MKPTKSLIQILGVLLVLGHTLSKVIEISSPSKSNEPSLQQIALNQSRAYARQLTIKGINSLTSRRDAGWGATALNSAYHKAMYFGQAGLVGSTNYFKNNQNVMQLLQAQPKKKIGMMQMSDQLYDFMGKHGIIVRAQADNNNHIRYNLVQKKHLDSEFNVKLNNKAGNYSVQFMSKAPFVQKSLTINQSLDLQKQISPFLEKSYRTWKRSRARELRLTSSTAQPKQLNQVPNTETLGPLKEEKKTTQKETQEKKKEIKMMPSLSLMHNITNSYERALNSQAIPFKNSNTAQDLRNPSIVLKDKRVPKMKKTNTKFVDALDDTSNNEMSLTERSLLEEQDVFPSLQNAVGDKMIIVPGEESSWKVYLKKEDGNQGDQICNVKITTEDDKRMIMMNNDDIFYLENSHKLAGKAVAADENTEALVEFFQNQLSEFVEAYIGTVNDQFNLERLAKYVKEEIFPKKQINLKSNIMKMDESNKETVFIVLDQIGSEPGNDGHPEVITQVRFFRINHLFNQIQISHGERVIELQVPRLMNQDQRALLEREILEVLDDEIINNTVGYSGGKDMVKNMLQTEQNCQSVTLEEQPIGNTSIVSISESDTCKFAGMSLILTGYDYGYIQYLHILLDNQYFQTEHMLAFTLKGDFNDNLKGIIDDMASEIEEVSKASNTNDGNEEISLETLKDKIKSTLGSEVIPENLSDTEVKFIHETPKGKKITIIRILVIKGTDDSPDLFRVFLFDPRNHSKHFSRSKSQHEYMMYANNGIDELKIFQKDLDKLAIKFHEQE